jgi:hypothetical protein
MPASRRPTIGRCSARSRPFLLGPDGPAGAPPGQRLRSGSYMAAIGKRKDHINSIQKCPRFQGNPEMSPLIAYLLVRIHGLSMWVGSSRSEGLMHSHASYRPR